MYKTHLDELEQFLIKLEINMNHQYKPPADFTISGEIYVYLTEGSQKHLSDIFCHLPHGTPKLFSYCHWLCFHCSRQDTVIELLIYRLSGYGWNCFSVLK